MPPAARGAGQESFVPEEDELLRRCQRGDESALGRLIPLLQERLFRLAFRVIGEAGRAEETTADVFLKVWDRCGQWRGEAAATTWIYRLALRTILDRARRRRCWWQPHPVDKPEVIDPHPTPLAAMLEKEREEERSWRLEQSLRQLAEDERAVLHLYYFERRPVAEIAVLMEVTEDAVKMRLLRARQKLKPLLEGCDELL